MLGGGWAGGGGALWRLGPGKSCPGLQGIFDRIYSDNSMMSGVWKPLIKKKTFIPEKIIR